MSILYKSKIHVHVTDTNLTKKKIKITKVFYLYNCFYYNNFYLNIF